MKQLDPQKWESVSGGPNDTLERQKVPGGYLYRTIVQLGADRLAVAMSFVPDDAR